MLTVVSLTHLKLNGAGSVTQAARGHDGQKYLLCNIKVSYSVSFFSMGCHFWLF